MYKILPLALTLLSLGDFGLGCRSETGIKFTNYGFPDASGTPAYKCSGSQVVQTQIGDRTLLGDGSFDRPYAAAAAANSVFPKCELIYIPLLKKHFRIQDDCSGCVATQVDLYLIQSNQNIGQTDCELQFGTLAYPGHALHQVIHNPARDWATDTRPLFVNGKCYNNPSDGRVFPARDGTLDCAVSRQGVLPGQDIDQGSVQGLDQDLDGGADAVDTSGSQNDNDAAARHRGQKPPNKRSLARDFRA